MAIIYGLKVNLSVAMVAMVNDTALRLANPHATDDHKSTLSVLNSTSTVSLIEECDAENRTSSGVSQVTLIQELAKYHTSNKC